MLHVKPLVPTLMMLPDAILVGSCFPILLHVDMFIALQGKDGLVGKFNPVNGQQSRPSGMSVRDVRKAFDQGKFVLDAPALRFGGLLGSERCQSVGTTSDCSRSDILVDLLGRSSLLQGDLSRSWSARAIH